MKPRRLPVSSKQVAEDHRFWDSAGSLRNYWYAACTSKMLTNGKLVASKVLGLGLVLFRQANGAPAALLDQCVHRGTALSRGRLVNNCIQCPYHGWRYRADGQVVHIPSQDGSRPPMEPHDFTQQSFPVREQDGLIWVFLGESKDDAPEPFRMPFWRERGWSRYYMVTTFAGNMETLAQNFMDVPHTVFVHDTIFRKSSAKTMHSTVEVTDRSVEVEYHEPNDSIGLMPWLTNPKREPLHHTDKYFAPNNTRCDYHWGDTSGFVITSTSTPTNDRECQVYTLISFRFPVPDWLQQMLVPFIHLYTRLVINQDVRIMEANQSGMDNAAFSTRNSVRADAVHIGIERLFQAYKTGSSVPSAQKGSRAVEFEM